MNEVVITGCGSISALGNHHAALTDWFQAAGQSDNPAGCIRGFEFNPSQLQFPVLKLDINSKYALTACAAALKEAGLPGYFHGTGIKAGILVANTYVGVDQIWTNLDTLAARGIRYITPYNCLTGMYSILSALCTELGISGFNNTINQSLTSGYAAIKAAVERIKAGYEDVMIVVGTDPLNKVLSEGANHAGVLSRQGVARPFDKNRDGAVLGEACGVLILESAEHAWKRGGRIHATISGIAFGSEERRNKRVGGGIAQAMERVLAKTGASIHEVDFIYANANSTGRLDLVNGLGIKQGTERTDKAIPVTAFKSVLGETLSAAGIMDVLAAVQTLACGYLPGIRGLEETDRHFQELRLVKQGEKGAFQYGMVNGTGIGGDCYSILIEKG